MSDFVVGDIEVLNGCESVKRIVGMRWKLGGREEMLLDRNVV